ncbi:MAG: hypothetical protein SNJ68_11500 [Cyanobacteriota bacterium]
MNQLMIGLGIPSSLQPSGALSHADRVNQVIRWAESSSGGGLDPLQQELANLLSPDAARS